MKLTSNRDTLSAIKNISFSTHNISPILSTFMLQVRNDELVVTGTDLETTTIAKMRVSDTEDGQCCINAKTLIAVIGELGLGDVDIYLDNEHCIIKQGKSVFRLLTADWEQFPEIPKIDFSDAMELEVSQLTAIQQVVGATVLKEMARPIFTGIWLQSKDDTLTAVSTDLRCITELVYKGEYGADLDIIIPIAGFNAIRGAETGSKAQVIIKENLISVRCGHVTTISRSISGKFPEYGKVLNVDNPFSVIFDRVRLLDALRQMSLITDKEFNRVTINIKDGYANLKTENAEVGNSETLMMIENCNNLEGNVAFNVQYLMNIVRFIETDKVKMTFCEPEASKINKQVLVFNEPDVTDKQIRWLIMPLRIK